ncbi:MAG: phosphatase PAP2 family protein [Ktedonobacterales bacterium]
MQQLINLLLRDNWQGFLDVNQGAGHQPTLDAVMIFSANDLIALAPLALLVLWFALARWSPLGKRLSQLAPDDSVRRYGQMMALMGCLAVGIAVVLTVVLGALVYEPRPFVSHPSVDHLLIAHAADASFPSDHESVVAAITTVLILYALVLVVRVRRLRRRGDATGAFDATEQRPLLTLAGVLAALALISAILIGVARIYVGVHYPGDILGGMLAGALAGLVAVALRRLLAPLLTPLIRLAERFYLA